MAPLVAATSAQRAMAATRESRGGAGMAGSNRVPTRARVAASSRMSFADAAGEPSVWREQRDLKRSGTLT
eukprot:1943725-Prymnesium_polylepis.1